jgi:hypothetical protein
MAVVTFGLGAVTIEHGARSAGCTLAYVGGDDGDGPIGTSAPSDPRGRPWVQGASTGDRKRRFRPSPPSPPSQSTEHLPAGVHDGGSDLYRPPHEPRAHTMASGDRELRHAHQLEGGMLEVTAGAKCSRRPAPDGERSRTVHSLGGAR